MTEPTDPTDDASAAETFWFERPHSLRHRLTSWLSRRTSIRPPHYYSALRYNTERDPERQAACRISDSYHVRVPVLWAAEFYTPDTIGRLYDALARLEGLGASASRESLDAWLRTTRAWPGSTHNLSLTPPGGKRLFDDGYRCPSPSFASHVGATILCVTPSLTMLVTRFELRDAERNWLDTQLHKDHPTRITALRGGAVETSDSQSEQRRLVSEKREAWLEETTGWYRRYFPGLLTTGGERVAMCAFTTVEGVEPFTREEERNPLVTALGFDWSHMLFEGSNGSDRKAFLLDYGGTFHGPAEMIHLAASEDKYLALDAQHYGGDQPQLFVLDEIFRPTFAAQALWRALQYYARRAAAARDDAATIIGRGSAAKALAKLRADSARCIDAATIARELLEILGDRWPSFHEMDFVERNENPRSRRHAGGPHSLKEITRARFTADAQSLLANVEELNSSLNAQANLLSAHANLKLQPWIILLGVLSFFAGAVAAIEPTARALDFPFPWSGPR